MNGHKVAQEICETFKERDLNEADTRHQIIDRLLHDVLAWPRISVKCEKSVHPGFADYVLLDKIDRPILLIEAKREGYYFELPKTVERDKPSLKKRKGSGLPLTHYLIFDARN